MIKRIDDWMIRQFTRGCHWFQRWTGKSNYWLAYWTLMAVALSCFAWIGELVIEQQKEVDSLFLPEVMWGILLATVAFRDALVCQRMEGRLGSTVVRPFLAAKLGDTPGWRVAGLVLSILCIVGLFVRWKNFWESSAVFLLVTETVYSYLTEVYPLPPGEARLGQLIRAAFTRQVRATNPTE